MVSGGRTSAGRYNHFTRDTNESAWLELSGLGGLTSTTHACFPVSMPIEQHITDVRLPELERVLLGTRGRLNAITTSTTPRKTC